MSRDKDKDDINPVSIALIILIGAIAVIPAFMQGSVAPKHYLLINLAAAAALAVWAGVMLVKAKGVIFYKTPVYIALGAFLYLTLITISSSVYTEASIHHFFKIANCVILFVIVTSATSNGTFKREELDLISLTVLFGGFTIAIFATLAPITFLPTDPLSKFPFPNRNHLAGYLELSIPMTLALYYSSRKMELKLTAIGLFLGMSAALLMSLSRGGIISFSIAMAFFIYLYFFHIRESRRRLVSYMLVPVAIIVIMFLVDLDPIREKFFADPMLGAQADTGSSERLTLYKQSLKLFADKPILGYGPGTFSYIIGQYRTPDVWGHPFYAHNDYLEILTDNGILGLLGVGAALFFGAMFFFRTMSVRRDSQKKVLGACCMVGVMALVLHGLVDFNLRIPSNMLLFTLMGALALSYVGLPSGAGRTSPYPEMVAIPLGKIRKGLILGALGIYIFFAVFLSLTRYVGDYHFRNGEMYLQAGEMRAAYYHFSKATKRVPGNAEYHYKKGISYFLNALEHNQSYNIAIKEIAEAAILNPMDSRYILDMASMMKEEKATNLFEPLAIKALSLEPGNPYLHKIMALQFLKKENPDQGLWHLRRALALEPKLMSEELLHDTWQMVPDTDKLMKGYTATPEALGRFAKYAHKMGEDRIAVKALQIALRYDPDNRELYLLLASHFLNQERYTEARQVVAIVNEKWPEESSGYRLMARCLIASGNEPLAEDNLRKAIVMNPGNAKNYSVYVKMLVEQKRENDLILFFKEILEERERDECIGELYFQLSKVYNRLEEWLLAVKYAKQALHCKPSHLAYSFYLMDLYIQRDLYFEAYSRGEQLLRVHGEDKNLLLKLAKVYELADKPDKARQKYLQLYYLHPNNMKYKRKLEELTR